MISYNPIFMPHDQHDCALNMSWTLNFHAYETAATLVVYMLERESNYLCEWQRSEWTTEQ